MAVSLLHLSPVAFWASTPAEFRAALDSYIEIRGGGSRASAPPVREELEAMMARFPD